MKYHPEYRPPGVDGNASEFYALPDIDVILKHLRLCGCDLHEFTRRYISEDDHRTEVLCRIMAMLESNPDKKKEFDEYRKAALKVQLLQAEDNLLRMAQPGSSNSMKALEKALELFQPSKPAAPASEKEAPSDEMARTQQLIEQLEQAEDGSSIPNL